MSFDYDLIAVGGGAAGLSMAITMQRLGFSTLLIDRTDHRIGGDCLNDGCIPSKALIHVSRQVHAARQVSPFGWRVEGKTNLAAVMRYVRERQDIIRAHENAAFLRKREGIGIELGTASFVGGQTLRIRHEDGTGKIVSAKNIVLCTGSKPQMLDVPGVENVAVYTNENLFTLDELPDRLLVVGAGPIGIEMAQAFQRLGSDVTVVGRDERILPKERPEVSDLLQQRLTGEGVNFRLGCTVSRFPDARTAELKTADGQTEQLPFDVVLVGIGRTFHYDDLNLIAAGIRRDERGRLVLNDYLQTTNPHVFAAGDAAAGAPAGMRYFSHAAELHVSVLTNNFVSPLKQKLSYDNFSWVTFTDPEVATFGLSEDELKQRGTPYERLDYNFTDDDRAVVEDYQYARMMLLTAPKGINPFRTRILGGTVIAPNAGELAQELILAVQKKLTAGDFFNKIYPYPTASRVNKNVWLDSISTGLPTVLKRAMKWTY